MQVDPASFTRPAFMPGGAPGMASFASTASLPEAAEHVADMSEGDVPPSSYLAALMPRRRSVITPAVLHVLEWHRQHDRARR